MPIIWHTKNINIQSYYKIIRRIIMLNGNNGTHLSGYRAWQEFKSNWTLHVIPVDQAEDYKQFYEHYGDINVSDGIAWGITGYKEVIMFIKDSRNPFKKRSNVMPFSHELLHALYQEQVGTFHIRHLHDIWIDGIRVMRKGDSEPAATVIVHDTWYATKTTTKLYIWDMFNWLPLTISYIPINKAKQLYPI